ncbi:hypothetical protein KI387_018337, partial [Taxus chinensis]
MIENLKSWAARFEFTKIPLLVKPMEEAEVKPQVVEALATTQAGEEGATPNPKEEEYILAVEKDHIVSEAPSVEQAIEEPSVLPPTSSPSSSNVEEEFEISNFMFEEEGNH